MNIVIYTKPGCPWSKGVMEYLNENKLGFIEKEVKMNGESFDELEKISGQTKTPTLVVDGHVIANTDREQVKKYFEGLKS